MVEEPAFRVEPAGETGEGAVGPDDAVTGDDDRQRIATDGRGDRPSRRGATDCGGVFAIGAGGAARDAGELGPDRTLELGTPGLEREIEAGRRVIEVGGELLDGSSDDGVGSLGDLLPDTAALGLPGEGPQDRAKVGVGGDQGQSPAWAVVGGGGEAHPEIMTPAGVAGVPAG